MWWEDNIPEAYEDTIRSVGSPKKTVTDNTAVLNGLKWTSVNRRYCSESGLIVSLHQHQNYFEGVGDNFKF